VNLGGVLPAVVLWALTFPLDFEFEPPSEHLAVQDFFYQVLFFTVNDFRWWRNCWVAAGYRVPRRWSEFDHIEHRVEASHWKGQLESVRTAGDLPFNREGVKPMV